MTERGWRTMDSAPSGCEILICYEAMRGRVVTAAVLDHGRWKTPTIWVDKPLGWQPMPAPPKLAKGGMNGERCC